MQKNKEQFRISRETAQLESHGKQGEAKFYLDGCSNALRSAMDTHLGSFAVHIYVNDVTRQVNIKVQQQLKIEGKPGDLTEAIVSKSLDEARLSLMASFGREDVRRK